MEEVNIIFPNQIFEESPLFKFSVETYILEESLFFNQYKFHKNKILFHRISMMKYSNYLSNHLPKVNYIDSFKDESDTIVLIKKLIKNGLRKLNYIDPCDNWLNKKLLSFNNQLELNKLESPQFLNSENENLKFFNPNKSKFFQTSFYKQQRQKLNILIQEDKPIGGKWTFDDENRKKYPKNKLPPKIKFNLYNKIHLNEAKEYINKYFINNYGIINDKFSYPTDFDSSKKWLNDFLNDRFLEFGHYEDAIVKNESVLNHSLLSPLINSGLLTPEYVIQEINAFAKKNNTPLNSYEGLIRQLIGWREFIRGIYIVKGNQERTTNFWNFNKKMPSAFYDSSTGIEPIDDCISKVSNTGYLHHIERLMVVGNFMFLCEIDPDEVYKWFMEFFIDSYDWVMVPNVYGMSQFADGGLMSTKPYISSSNYIMKMSNYKKSNWQEIWDGLYWRFIYKNQDFFKSNPRLSMMVNTLNKMKKEKLEKHLSVSENYLLNLK